MKSDSHSLSNLVNSSGFAFQLAVEHQVRSTSLEHNWEVVSAEHAWVYEPTGDSGFADLVLRSSEVVAVVECKRTRDADWVFLVPESESHLHPKTKCSWLSRMPDASTVAGWDDLPLRPDSYESAFCAVRGSGERDMPMLERLAARLVRATDAIAEEEHQLLVPTDRAFLRIYVPIIVTTAALHVCKIDPSTVSLENGRFDVEDGEFEDVPFVRFRKALSTEKPPGVQPRDLASAAISRERSVLVVRAAELVDFLRGTTLEIDRRYGHRWPWEIEAERRLQKPRS